MHKRMTITLDEAVYDGLYRRIGKRKMSQFIEDLLRPHVLDTALEAGYAAMAADQEREVEAVRRQASLLLLYKESCQVLYVSTIRGQ